MQMNMLDKADQYEKERRTQSAELVKISALLKGQRSQQETIQLAIKSLNLSLSALKRTKEIVEEMIRRHLGWLVLWGGVFGGLIGLAVQLIERWQA